MVKLINLLNETLNTYIVECSLLTNPEFNITEILNNVRALEKVTIVNNLTPPDFPQKEKMEYTKITIKFITSQEPKSDLKYFRDRMLHSSKNDNGSVTKIEGIKHVKFNINTLKRV